MICANSCINSIPIIGAGCFGNTATKKLRVKYNMQEEEVLDLCDRCIIVVSNDARKKGFKVHVIRKPERNPMKRGKYTGVTKVMGGYLYKKVGWYPDSISARQEARESGFVTLHESNGYSLWKPIRRERNPMEEERIVIKYNGKYYVKKGWTLTLKQAKSLAGKGFKIAKESYGFSIWVPMDNKLSNPSGETVLWGTKKGDPSWKEQLITCSKDPNHVSKAKKWAKDNGFINLRTSIHREGDKPDFKGTINNPAALATVGYGLLVGTGFEIASVAAKHVTGGARKNPKRRKK